MMSNTSFQRLIALDGVRGLAVTLLVLSHFMISKEWESTDTWKIVHGGWLGVDLFFVLSGFLITGILIDTRDKATYFGSFFKRRLLRIFPLYYFCLLIALFCVYFIEKAPERLTGYDSMGWFFAYASNIAIALKDAWTYQSDIVTMGHFWSLAVEEQFYLVWPFVVYFVPLRWLLALSGLIVFTGPEIKDYFDGFFGKDSLASYVLTPCRMDALAAGSLLACLLRLDKKDTPKNPHDFRYPALFLVALWIISTYKAWKLDDIDLKWNAAIYLFGMFIVLPQRKWIAYIMFVYGALTTGEILIEGGHQEKWTFPILFFFSFLYLSLEKTWIKALCETRFLTHMGKYSYAIYIFHHFCKPWWEYLFGNELFSGKYNPWIAQGSYIVLASLGTYVLARISWVIIEKPMLDLKEKWAPVK